MTIVLRYRGVGGCDAFKSAAIYVGLEGRALEKKELAGGFLTTETASCTDGEIGTLVITPSEGADRAAVLVVGGVGRAGSDCRGPAYEGGCIAARRQFSFANHTRLTMPIDLDIDCQVLPCEAVTTCSKGTCVSSEVTCDEDGSCDLVSIRSGADAGADGFSGDARGDEDGGSDASSADATLDAPADADAGSTSYSCGNGVAPASSCSRPSTCCYSNDTTFCTNPGSCFWGARTCNGTADCPGQICCSDVVSGASGIGAQGSSCRPACEPTAKQLCTSTNDCGGGPCSDFFPMPGERYCQ